MISVKVGTTDYEDMELKDFVQWLKQLNKSIDDCWKICVNVDIGERNVESNT